MPNMKQSPKKSKASPRATTVKQPAKKAVAAAPKKVAPKAKPAAAKKPAPQPNKPVAQRVAPAVKPALPISPVISTVRRVTTSARAIEVAAAPTAATCPLVLDGELSVVRFSPKNCLSCDEFDCRFCQAEEGSGDLSSLFGDEDSDEDQEVDGFSFDRASDSRDDFWDDSSENDY